ncbi:hypothetical protein ALC57_00287 [Trachymyrmex cornetzi]|uniref:Uncharacterized protein n=1 Tax=Trachymyrmex cornetzi TaxID=471704 RepID=A0A151JS86_9HYME|nr:hypothetical protein ALC57_00287 [Trachymyrmex cornetzi]
MDPGGWTYGKDLSVGRLVVAALLWLVPVALRVTGPQSEVVAQQLHDQCGIFVAVFIKCVQLRDRVVERLEHDAGWLVWYQ